MSSATRESGAAVAHGVERHGHEGLGVEELSMQQALNRALDEVLATQPKAVIFGEDCGRLGGVFRVTDGLQVKYGETRVFDTPLAESGILGMSVGLAMAGFHPIPRYSSTASPIRPSTRSSARSDG